MDIMLKKGPEDEFKYEFVDNGGTAVVRIFQLKFENEIEPEILILIEAGKAVNDDRMWYHVIQESGLGYEPNGDYATMPEDEIEKRFHLKIHEDTPNTFIVDVKKDDIKPLFCVFADKLNVFHVTEEQFEKLCSLITDMPIDIEITEKQRYFHVLTDKGLVTFKKISK